MRCPSGTNTRLVRGSPAAERVQAFVMSPATAILVTLVVYKLVLIGLGIWAQRRTATSSDFFLGDRQLGPWVAAISASASSSSAWTLLGVSGAAYQWGLGAIWLFPSCVGGFVINWVFIAPALRRLSHKTGALTLTELLARGAPGRHVRRFGHRVAVFVDVRRGSVSGRGQGISRNLRLAGGVEHHSWRRYRRLLHPLGRVWAVSLTDTLQGLLMAATAVLLPVAALLTVDLSQLADTAPPGFWSLTRGMPPAAGVGFVLGLLGIGLGYPGQPHVVNRFMAIRDEASMRSARLIALGWAVVVYAGMLTLGWAGRVLVPELADNEVVFVCRHPTALSARYIGHHDCGRSVGHHVDRRQSAFGGGLFGHARTLGGAGGRRWRSRVGSSSRSARSRWRRRCSATAVSSIGSCSPGRRWGPRLARCSSSRCGKGRLGRPRAISAMLAGFVLSVAAYSIPDTRGTAFERVLPFIVALAIAVWGAGPKRHES